MDISTNRFNAVTTCLFFIIITLLRFNWKAGRAFESRFQRLYLPSQNGIDQKKKKKCRRRLIIFSTKTAVLWSDDDGQRKKLTWTGQNAGGYKIRGWSAIYVSIVL